MILFSVLPLDHMFGELGRKLPSKSQFYNTSAESADSFIFTAATNARELSSTAAVVVVTTSAQPTQAENNVT